MFVSTPRTAPFIAKVLAIAIVCASFALTHQVALAQPASNLMESWPAPPPDKLDPLLLSVLRNPSPEIPHDPLHKVDDQSQIKGTLVYTPRIIVYETQPANYFVVFRQVNGAKDFNGTLSASAAYIAGTQQHVFEPTYSPDGKKLILKVGRPDAPYGGYRLCMWDMEKQRILYVPDRLAFRKVSWSADSNLVAYVEGGDEYGREADDMTGESYPSHLSVFDLTQDKASQVLEWMSVTDFSWTSTGKLLFSHAEESAEDKETPATETHHPAIYEVKPSDKSPVKLVSEAQLPLASPDDKWIAFLGWFDDPQTKEAPKSRLQVYGIGLYNKATKARHLIQTLSGKRRENQLFQPQLKWNATSDTLWWLDNSYQGHSATAKVNQIKLSQLFETGDVQTAQSTLLATIQMVDQGNDGRDSSDLPVRFLASTKDQQFLILDLSRYTGENRSFMTEQKSLVALHIADGSLKTLAEAENKWDAVRGWDWKED